MVDGMDLHLAARKAGEKAGLLAAWSVRWMAGQRVGMTGLRSADHLAWRMADKWAAS